MNNFLPILDNWQDYFKNPYEGLGTTYERILLHSIFKMIDIEFKITTVAEIPIFGMTGISGINSIWWERQGKTVFLFDDHLERLKLIRDTWKSVDSIMYPICTAFDSLPLVPKSIDLVWNFASLWFIPNLLDFADRIKSYASKIILICVPNRKGIGFLLRKYLFDIPNSIYLNNIASSTIKNIFTDHNWKFWKEGLFDVPPWPDIPMKKEDLLSKLRLGFLLKMFRGKSNLDQQPTPITILDYYADRNPELESQILRYSFLENFPKFIKTLWGHHRYFIFYKNL
jgi:hypothetical protein